MGEAAVVEGFGVIGIELNRLIKIWDSKVVLALMDVGFPTTLKGSGVFPVQLDRLSKIFDSKVVLALLRMSDAKVVEGPKKTRIDLDGLIEIRNGTVILALQAIGRAAAPGPAPRAVVEIGVANIATLMNPRRSRINRASARTPGRAAGGWGAGGAPELPARKRRRGAAGWARSTRGR